MSKTKRTICNKCVLDTSVPDLTFDKDGVCNWCHIVEEQEQRRLEEKKNLPKILETLRKNKVLIGLSGGADSSFSLHTLVKEGIKPLTFTTDNGWQSEKANRNITKLVRETGVKFINYPVNGRIFSELQIAFLRAGLPNAEIPSDHLLMAITYKIAAKNGIRYIVSGGNQATESVMPASWSYPSRDLRQMKDVYKKQTGKKLVGLPVCGWAKWNYYRWIKRIKIINLLDYYEYNREKAVTELSQAYGYEPYGLKHEENTYTCWFMNFYLYQKFGVDKRRAHLSSLIHSGQITRRGALAQLKFPPEYPKLGIEQRVLEYPIQRHEDYATEEWLWNTTANIVRWIKRYVAV